jgi:hypothetical protein
MKKLIVALMLAASSVMAHSQEWVTLSKAGSTTYDGLVGSVKVIENDGNVKVVVVTGRVSDSATNKITGEMWYVTVSHCRAKQGALVSLDLLGKFKYDNTFVFGMGSVASAIAEIVCNVGLNPKGNTGSGVGV